MRSPARARTVTTGASFGSSEFFKTAAFFDAELRGVIFHVTTVCEVVELALARRHRQEPGRCPTPHEKLRNASLKKDGNEDLRVHNFHTHTLYL